MIALIFDDSNNMQGNIVVADRDEYKNLVGMLPDGWYGELREGLNGRKLHNHYAGHYVQVKCVHCGNMIIEQRMNTHMHRNHNKRSKQ